MSVATASAPSPVRVDPRKFLVSVSSRNPSAIGRLKPQAFNVPLSVCSCCGAYAVTPQGTLKNWGPGGQDCRDIGPHKEDYIKAWTKYYEDNYIRHKQRYGEDSASEWTPDRLKFNAEKYARFNNSGVNVVPMTLAKAKELLYDNEVGAEILAYEINDPEDGVVTVLWANK